MDPYDREKAWSDLRVGLISFAALFFLVLGITFAGGDKGLLFKKTSTVQAWLTNVGGLKKGATVTMSGMMIGKVTDVAFAGESHTSPIEVTMEIRSDIRNRIKVDSTPSVRTQGMLGDRYIDIPIGSNEAEVLSKGKPLMGKTATDFDETLHEAINVLQETEKLMSTVNKGEGTVGRLIYDQNFYARLMEITSELNDLLKDFKKNPRKYIKFSVF